MTTAQPESPYAWMRLAASLALMTLGGVAMYGVVVVLPAVQAEFGVTRAEAALPYTLTMIGFALGGVVMGRLADRHGVMVPVLIGTVALGAGLILAGASGIDQVRVGEHHRVVGGVAVEMRLRHIRE